MPTTLVLMNSAGPSIDRSTWLSAAKCITASGSKLDKNVGDGRTIADIGAAEAIARMALDRSQRGEIAGIGQLVDDQHLVIGVADEMPDQCRPDEARSTRDQIFMLANRGRSS